MPVVPSNVVPIHRGKTEPQVDDTYLALAAASVHEMGRLFEQPTNMGPIYHNPNWIGNKLYKDHFETGDQVIDIEKKTGKQPGVRTPSEPPKPPSGIPPYLGPNKIV